MSPSFCVAAYMASVGRNALSCCRAPVWGASCGGRGVVCDLLLASVHTRHASIPNFVRLCACERARAHVRVVLIARVLSWLLLRACCATLALDWPSSAGQQGQQLGWGLGRT